MKHTTKSILIIFSILISVVLLGFVFLDPFSGNDNETQLILETVNYEEYYWYSYVNITSDDLESCPILKNMVETLIFVNNGSITVKYDNNLHQCIDEFFPSRGYSFDQPFFYQTFAFQLGKF